MQTLVTIILFPITLMMNVLSSIFGKVAWSMPPWLVHLNTLRKAKPLAFILTLFVFAALLIGGYKGYDYYQNLPVPKLIEAKVNLPKTSMASAELSMEAFDSERQESLAKKNPLGIQFSYNKGSSLPSVAPIELIGAEIKTGIKIRPAKEGEWMWVDDRTISFIPLEPWPPGEEYEVSFAPEVFSTSDEFASDYVKFTTVPLSASLEAAEFNLDPETQEKRVYFDFNFTYPVSLQSVKENISLAYLEQNGETTKLNAIENVEYALDANKMFVSVSYSLTALPEQSRIVQASVSEGLRSIYGGAALSNALTSKVTVPDVYSFLEVSDFTVDIVRSPENDPEQFILLSFTDLISRDELLQKVSLYRLPKGQEEQGKNYWESPRQVSTQVLSAAKKVNFELMPTQGERSTDYQIRIDRPENEQLYFKIDAGLRSANGFIQRSFFDRIIAAPQYPKEVIINGEGSVMTYSTDQRLAFTTRGLDSVLVSIGKVIDDDLYHLVSQSQGDISNPNFNSWSFGPENLAEFTTKKITMDNRSGKPQDPSYASVDFNALVSKQDGKVGLFFVEIKGWNKQNNREEYGINDKLLLLVTDLGVIVKTSNDQSQDIFVQSLKQGKPVAGAKVELLAKNGTALFTKTTDARGHASLPSASGFNREKEPTVFVISHEGDVSFIPFNRYTRQINYSRFEVFGRYDRPEQEEDTANQANAFMFSDRGIYRPGETVKLAAIVKGKNFRDLSGIPLELVIRDPRYTDVLVERLILPEMGLLEYEFPSESGFATGDYVASLHLVRTNRQSNGRTSMYRDRQIGSVTFQVEAFQPDTMAITSEIEGLEENKGWLSGSSIKSKVSLTNLFGSPAQLRDVNAGLNLMPRAFNFKEYDGYAFNSIVTASDVEITDLDIPSQSATTDADGIAEIAFDVSNIQGGSYIASQYAEGFEASGGRSVKTTSTFRYSPQTYMLGYSADGRLAYVNKGSERKVHLLAINSQLQPIALEGISQRLSQLKTISTLVKQWNGRYEYQSIEQKLLVSTDEISLSANGLHFILDAEQAGTYLLEYLDPQGRLLSAFKYTIVGEGNDTGELSKDAQLKLSLNKQDFAPGEEIELSIQAPYAGSGLITIESNKVHHFSWFTSDTKNTVQRITIPKNMEGNAYVNLSFVRDASSPEIFANPLSYAVQPFSIDRNKRRIATSIATDEIAQPGEALKIDVDLEEDAKLVVFAVDVGILNVASYSTPDPLSHFLQKRALGVRTMQILDLILPDFALAKSLSAAGGDMERSAEADMFAEKISVTGSRIRRTDNPFAKQIQKPVVYWSGIVDGKKGVNTLTYDVPEDFAGGLRVMAVSVSQSKVGSAQKSLLVRGPFVLSPNILNQAAPGDEFDITLGIANLVENSGQDAEVSIQISMSEHLSLLDESNQRMQLTLDENQEDYVRFRVKANAILGAAKVSFDVSLTDQSGRTWRSSRSANMSVRPAMPYQVDIATGQTNDEVKVDLRTDFYVEQSSHKLRVSSSPLVIVEGLSDYLADYPHGCTEQMISQVFPLVGLSNLAKYKATSGSKESADVLAHFNELLTTLRQRQTYAGGFSYWPGQEANDLEVSLYVMHFLLDARELGYPVPQDMLQSGINYIDSTLSAHLKNKPRGLGQRVGLNNNMVNVRNRAYGIYLLTRFGVVTSNLLIDLLDDLNHTAGQGGQTDSALGNWKKDIAAAYIASSYRLMQMSDEAQALITGYDVSEDKPIAQAIMGKAPRLALDAQYIYLLAKHFPSLINSMAQDSSLPLSSAVRSMNESIYQGNFNTLSAAYSTLALGAYHSAIGSDNIEAIDKQIVFTAYRQQQAAALMPRYNPFPTVSFSSREDRVTAKKENGDLTPLHFVSMQAGYQTKVPSEPLKQGIEIQRAFLNENGEAVTEFVQGQKVMVRLRVRATDKDFIDNVAIVDLLPGGFEVLRESVNRRAGPWQSEYIDIRDDRIVYYGQLTKRVTEIKYQVQLTAAGKFVVPPSFAESMYDRALKAWSASSSVIVTEDEE
ncbi:alpha-2-macroglobulin [Alteromonas sp. W364]|uniref:alpha-2-macroglobulin family protein n=1 Tax=Alteromonas sp. W364 TaxID=3075610 RepID=UPI002888A9D3|nr:alpha-2-macroglobulin [Alteromonas sp. W364]MDT0627973.1 alpha-2-macroglobulin [Alteromonas sp. W364]